MTTVYIYRAHRYAQHCVKCWMEVILVYPHKPTPGGSYQDEPHLTGEETWLGEVRWSH